MIKKPISIWKRHLAMSLGIILLAMFGWPAMTRGDQSFTVNVDVNNGTAGNYTGTAVAPDSGTVWNGLGIGSGLASVTNNSISDSQGNLLAGVRVIIASHDGVSQIYRYSTTGNSAPNPQNLMMDYTYSGTYDVTVSGLPAGAYGFWYYGHGDANNQAGTVTLDAGNGGGSGSTANSVLGRDLYSGGPGISYASFGGKPVSGAGTFKFQVSNFLNGFQLQLASPPVLAGLTNQTIIQGNTAVLSPVISGVPYPALQWRSNNVPMIGQTNASLILNNVQYVQNGAVYSLAASNGAGAVTNSMTLTVLVTPAINGPANQAVAVGATVTIPTTVTGVPTPATRWQLGGNSLSDGATGNGSTISGSATSMLVITNAQAADTGTYSLVATNSAGKVTNSMTLTVSAGNVAPSITGPTDQTVVRSNNATFSASVSGLPVPMLQWCVNGVDIPGQTNSSLTVSNVQYAQNGFVYSLVASNAAGQTTNSTMLYVLVPPAISQQPTNLSIVVGNPATFSVTASGVPVVKFQWRKNTSPIANATNAAYTLSNPQGADNGAVFSVVVTNSVGSVTSSNATLTVLSMMTGACLPTNNATGIAPDQQLRIIFPRAIKLGSSGVIKISDAANDTVVAMIDSSQFLSYVPGNTSIQDIPNAAIRSVQGAGYYYMPITIYGNEAWFTFTNRLAYNKTYYVNVDPGLLLDTNNAAMAGISGSTNWRFSTKASGPTTPTTSTGLTTITIGQDGTGDFATFQGAFDWIPQNNTLLRTIRVKPGIYRDNATLAQNRNFVTIVGEGASRTNAQLIYPFAFFGPPNTVFTAGSLRIESSDVTVLNLTLDNIIYNEFHPTGESSSGAAGAFAGAINTLATTGKRIVFDNVLIKGGQDTIYNISGIVYYNNCEIWGSVDFIYGKALAVFDQCTIVEIRNSGGPITAPNTDYAQPYGLTFLNCTFPRALIANGYPFDVGTGNSTFQRPWGKDGMTAIINCAVGSQISTQGWLEWGNRQTTCRAREYGTTLIGGGSVTPSQRQTAGAYWLNTIDPDYVSNPAIDPDADGSLLLPPTGSVNRTNITVNPADYTLAAIFGNAYFNLSGWLPKVIPAITAQPTNKTVSAGSSAIFSVAAAGLPDPTYQWHKNGTNILGATNTTFTIPSVNLADNAIYSVLVTNSAGSITSSNVVLTVPAVSVHVTAAVIGGALSLAWPVEMTGYHLEVQTNELAIGLTTNWFTVVGSTSTNQVFLPIDPVNPGVFLRLAYP